MTLSGNFQELSINHPLQMIYFDNNATTQVAPEVFQAMSPFLTELYGATSSAHTFGRQNRLIVEKSREQVASLIGANSPEEIFFTSGGTESINRAIWETLEAYPRKKHIITTRVEHEAVRKLCKKLEKQGFRVTWLKVSEQGFLDLETLKKSLCEETALVSVMWANDETGILFPIAEIAEIVKANSKAIFHVDGAIAVGKIPIDLKKTQIDLFSLSGHKFHAPKGIGALYVRGNSDLTSHFAGGGEEKMKCAETEAVHQIVGLGKAAEIAGDFSAMRKVFDLRNKLENHILSEIPDSRLNGTADHQYRLPNTSSISFPNLNGEAILAQLNDLGIYVSTSSACNSENHSPSPVLQAMNIPYSQAMGTIRFSLSRYNLEEEIELVMENLPKIISALAEMK